MNEHGFAWHVHHDVLMEPLTVPLEVRLDNIRRCKPPCEVPLRERLLRRVQGRIPPQVVAAGEAYVKVLEVCDKPREVYDKVLEVWDKAVDTCKVEIDALHEIECPDCPWDGTTIFSGRRDSDG